MEPRAVRSPPRQCLFCFALHRSQPSSIANRKAGDSALSKLGVTAVSATGLLAAIADSWCHPTQTRGRRPVRPRATISMIVRHLDSKKTCMSDWDARCQSPIPISHEAEGGLGPSPIDVPDGSDLHWEATMAADSAAAAEGDDTAVTGSQPPAFCQCPSSAIGPLGARGSWRGTAAARDLLCFPTVLALARAGPPPREPWRPRRVLSGANWSREIGRPVSR